MKKIIKIDGKEYTMQSSAYTQFKYKNDTGRKLMQDLSQLTEMRKTETGILSELDDFMEIILRIAYVMIEESDPKQTGSFDEFLKSTDNLFEETNWVNEVIELAMTPISGGAKGNPQ